jgi:hypothetical protein
VKLIERNLPINDRFQSWQTGLISLTNSSDYVSECLGCCVEKDSGAMCKPRRKDYIQWALQIHWFHICRFDKLQIKNIQGKKKFSVLNMYRFFILFYFFAVLRLELRAFTLSHFTSPIFCDRVFQDRVSRTICTGWL